MAYVMIVDDDEDFALAASTVLTSAGHEVGIQMDTKSALASLQERVPDLMVLDVMFPENPSAGFELARQIRTHGASEQAFPILMLTAVNQAFPLGFSSQDIDAAWLPVTAFVEKPVDLDVLANKVSELLAGNAPADTTSA